MIRRAGQSAGGFTLTEVLIAIGILGIGLAMAAALFPAALKQHESSYRDSVGMMICENGLTVAKAVLDANNVPITSTPFITIADELNVGNIPRTQQHYPAGLDDANLAIGERMRGFVVLGKRTNTDPNAHQLVAISYSREEGNRIAAVELTGVDIINDANDPDRSILTNVTDDRFLCVGGWVIGVDGDFARITGGVPGGEWFVSPRPLNALTTQSGQVFRTVVEILDSDPSPNQADWTVDMIAPRSPVLAIMSTRTALRN